MCFVLVLAELTFYPSEVPPPGCEEEANIVSYLEKISAKQTKPLIGLEYVVELVDRKAKEPFYVCTLCDKRCDPRNITPQITSHRHRIKYLVSMKPLIQDSGISFLNPKFERKVLLKFLQFSVMFTKKLI